MKRVLACCAALICLSIAATLHAAEPAQSLTTAAAQDSLAILEKAVARDSTKFDNLMRLGVMYLDRDRVTEATKVFRRAAQIRPKDVKALVNLGAAYDAAGSGDLAQIEYRKALAASPRDSVAACRLASSLYAQGKYTESMDQLRGVIEKSAGAYCAYFTMGVAFADAGIYPDAIRLWKKVVALAPESPEAISARESIEVLEKYLTRRP